MRTSSNFGLAAWRGHFLFVACHSGRFDCVRSITAELWELAENLHRLDLTKDQRDEHIRRYAELLEARREVSRQNGAKPASTPVGGRPKGVASEVADETGISVRTVQRALNPKPAPELKNALRARIGRETTRYLRSAEEAFALHLLDQSRIRLAQVFRISPSVGIEIVDQAFQPIQFLVRQIVQVPSRTTGIDFQRR